MQHKKIWKTKILPNYAECADPSTETPRLCFRRNAHLSVAEERAVSNVRFIFFKVVSMIFFYHLLDKLAH